MPPRPSSRTRGGSEDRGTPGFARRRESSGSPGTSANGRENTRFTGSASRKRSPGCEGPSSTRRPSGSSPESGFPSLRPFPNPRPCRGPREEGGRPATVSRSGAAGHPGDLGLARSDRPAALLDRAAALQGRVALLQGRVALLQGRVVLLPDPCSEGLREPNPGLSRLPMPDRCSPSWASGRYPCTRERW